MLRIGILLFGAYLLLVALVYFRQRSMIYFPTHGAVSSRLTPWSDGERLMGFCREVLDPRVVWLMLHGNAGQAAHREYILDCMSDRDSLYVLEYPGYGHREGSPSMESINAAAVEAYRLLRARNPGTPVCVLGESIGSGPACVLAGEERRPDKVVLITPFDSLANLAARKLPFLPVRLMLRDDWDNAQSLRDYDGPVEIYGAVGDGIIPVAHAKALAERVPTARFKAISGGHNDWAMEEVKLEP